MREQEEHGRFQPELGGASRRDDRGSLRSRSVRSYKQRRFRTCAFRSWKQCG